MQPVYSLRFEEDKGMSKKEKVIIQSDPIDATKAVQVIFLLGAAITAIVLFVFLAAGWKEESLLFALCTFAFFALIALIVYLAFNKMQIVVTDKRVYGRGFWGRRMSLPCDQISSISTTILFGGITIGTSSGYLRWYCLGDKMKFYNVINDIFVERQNKEQSEYAVGGDNKASRNASTVTFDDLPEL